MFPVYMFFNAHIIFSVRAFGDPLFLKQNYGRGYQLNLVVEQRNNDEVVNFISSILPNAEITTSFTGHAVENKVSNSGQAQIQSDNKGLVPRNVTLFVTVPRGDLRGFPRLFSWLEGSQRASSIVNEWGISNTTLEEVFLLLCTQNREINHVANKNDENSESKQRDLCTMCQIRPKANAVIMRNAKSSQYTLVPNSLCDECGNFNPHFEVDEETYNGIELMQRECMSRGLLDESYRRLTQRRVELLTKANASAELATTQRLLQLEAQREANTQGVVEDALKDWETFNGSKISAMETKDELEKSSLLQSPEVMSDVHDSRSETMKVPTTVVITNASDVNLISEGTTASQVL
jgi:hypothetical protein